jgi:hypothetical protein
MPAWWHAELATAAENKKATRTKERFIRMPGKMLEGKGGRI